MAKMYPDKMCIEKINKSRAEKEMFEKFKNELSDDYRVIYSFLLKEHIKKIEGEIDFIILCKRGILCVEVKGGDIKRKNREWFINGEGNKEDPFEQAKDNMYSLKKYLTKDNNSKDSSNGILEEYGYYKGGKVFFARVVIAPDTTKEKMILEDVNDIDKKKLITKTELDDKNITMEELINNLFDNQIKEFNESEKGKNVKIKNLDNKIIDDITDKIAKDIGYCLSMDMKDEECVFNKLTEEQLRILKCLGENKRVILEGTSGTGKTWLLLQKVKMLLEDEETKDKKILFTCYNIKLANFLKKWVKNNVKENENIKISNFDEYLYDEFNTYTESFQGKNINSDFFKNCKKYDFLVIDEVQDLLTKSNLIFFDNILNKGLKNGNWYIALDKKQNIYKTKDEEIEELNECITKLKNECNPVIYVLNENCRNTKQIKEFNEKFTKVLQDVRCNTEGYDVKIEKYKTKEEEREKVKEIKIKKKKEIIKIYLWNQLKKI